MDAKKQSMGVGPGYGCEESIGGSADEDPQRVVCDEIVSRGQGGNQPETGVYDERATWCMYLPAVEIPFDIDRCATRGLTCC